MSGSIIGKDVDGKDIDNKNVEGEIENFTLMDILKNENILRGILVVVVLLLFAITISRMAEEGDLFSNPWFWFLM